MNEKDFRKLKRVELYEIMLAQAEEIDDLRAKLAAAKKELKKKGLIFNVQVLLPRLLLN